LLHNSYLGRSSLTGSINASIVICRKEQELGDTRKEPGTARGKDGALGALTPGTKKFTGQVELDALFALSRTVSSHSKYELLFILPLSMFSGDER
jgi:hypothetical protein